MAVIIEGHFRWSLAAAIRIGRALKPFDPLWLEDLIRTDNAADVQRLQHAVQLPVAASERLMTRYAFRQLLREDAAHVVMFDPTWTGGVTESLRIGAMASAYNLPITPHDCGGPVGAFVNLQLCAAFPHAIFYESVRDDYNGWYREVVDDRLPIEGGDIAVPSGPGVGTTLRDDFIAREDVTTRSSDVVAQ
jgi:L-alanine-DL-glutamate epimerase-like enolase superfamily enzyme